MGPMGTCGVALLDGDRGLRLYRFCDEAFQSGVCVVLRCMTS